MWGWVKAKVVGANLGARDEGDGEALGAEAPGAADAVQVLVGLVREVVVDDDVDALDVDAAAEEVGRHQDALVELLPDTDTDVVTEEQAEGA